MLLVRNGIVWSESDQAGVKWDCGAVERHPGEAATCGDVAGYKAVEASGLVRAETRLQVDS